MRLVKAKLKQVFDDPRAQCCSEYGKQIKAAPAMQGIVTLDLDDFLEEQIHCSYCHANLGIVHGVAILEYGRYIAPIYLFDIDEAPCQPYN